MVWGVELPTCLFHSQIFVKHRQRFHSNHVNCVEVACLELIIATSIPTIEQESKLHELGFVYVYQVEKGSDMFFRVVATLITWMLEQYTTIG